MSQPSLLESIWGQRDLGLELPGGFGLDKFTHSDVEYLSNYVYPYIQIVNTNANFSSEITLRFITEKCGWVIHDYGDAISTCAPHVVQEDEKGGEGGSGTGTIIGQQEIVANEIAQMVKEKGWPAVELIAGSSIMKQFLWLETKLLGLDFKNYDPTAEDERRYERVTKLRKTAGLVPGVAPKKE